MGIQAFCSSSPRIEGESPLSEWVEDHPSGCKWLGSPPFRSRLIAICKGSHNPILRGLTITIVTVLTIYKSLDAPSGWNLHFSFHFQLPGLCWWNWSLKNSRLQTVQKRNVWAIFLTQQKKFTNQLDWSNRRMVCSNKNYQQVWLGCADDDVSF